MMAQGLYLLSYLFVSCTTVAPYQCSVQQYILDTFRNPDVCWVEQMNLLEKYPGELFTCTQFKEL